MESRLQNTRFGFIGGGNMALAIAQGLVSKDVIPKVTAVSGPHPEKYVPKWGDFTESISPKNWEVVQKCNVIFLCMKPNLLAPVMKELAAAKDKYVLADKVFVSVLAGTTKAMICDAFGSDLRIVRTMPNICVQVGEGCCMVAENGDGNADDEFINWIMNRVGTAAIIGEDKFEAYPGLTGCGPAYVFTIIDALADGAVKQGVPRDLAIKFASQTVLGAAKTQLVTGKHPGVLKDEVCSPGGTTIVGVHELEKGALRSTLINAIQAATDKSKGMLK